MTCPSLVNKQLQVLKNCCGIRIKHFGACRYWKIINIEVVTVILLDYFAITTRPEVITHCTSNFKIIT